MKKVTNPDGGFGDRQSVKDAMSEAKGRSRLEGGEEVAGRASPAPMGFGETDLFAAISHEVRTPLNSVIGFSEMMMAESFGPLGHEKYRGYVRDIHMSAQHALSLINDLLDISKLQAGAFELAPEALDVNALLSQCVGAMEPMAKRGNVVLSLDLSSDILAVEMDKRALKQILFNILSNAIKFTPAEGRVFVSSAANDEHEVVICVEDTGGGMSEADVIRAFKPFQQVRSADQGATEDERSGTGLGLPLARALARANGGHLTLKSQVGVGTRAEITFPALAQGVLGL